MKDAVSFRTRKTSIYDKKSNTPFKISRSKFFNFLSCKRCFYLDRVKGLKEPSMPGWALNVAVDELLKKEFDQYRKEQKPHPIMIKHNLNFVPYEHKDLDTWRNSLKGGISYLESMTRPGADVESLGLEANMKSAQATVSYPLIYSRNEAFFARFTVGWTDEVQQTNAGGTDEDLSHDRITAARFGTSFSGCYYGCVRVDTEVSKGLELASRSNSEVGEGTPLSKSTASSNFTHFS